MIVNLAGFNVDINNINTIQEFIKKKDFSENEINRISQLQWTPETISASYARISRDPRPINQLREEAQLEIDKARKSNSTIIFDMGHSSIAEHAYFNFDIIGISRLLSELLEKHRLVSFTEKSQRYIKIGEDIHIPEEFKNNQPILEKYKQLTKDLFESYLFLLNKLEKYFIEKYNVSEKDKNYNQILNFAKEDARYILPLGVLTQLGMSINARNLEYVIRKLDSYELIEAKELAKKLFDLTESYAPSLIKYTKPTSYELNCYNEIKNLFLVEFYNTIPLDQNDEVILTNYDKNFENNFFAALLTKTLGINYNQSQKMVSGLSENKKEQIFNLATKDLNFYDKILKEFELSDFTFSIVISATAFAQLKRHRLTTIIDAPYNPFLGIKIPDSIKEIGLFDYFSEKIYNVNKFYNEIKDKYNIASNYILTNSHRKNIILKTNFRELNHIIRLRSDKHAQWDIRNISDKMINILRNISPLFSKILSGKDNFKI